MAHELRDFLASLANDETLNSYNSMTVDDARAYLQSKGLNTEQENAVLSRDATAVAHQLSLEGEAGTFLMAAGPTMKGPARFSVTLEGTMQGTMSARQGTMDATQATMDATQGTMDPSDPSPESRSSTPTDDQGDPNK